MNVTAHKYTVHVMPGALQVIPTEGLDFEAFATTVQAKWDKLWAEVYSADASRESVTQKKQKVP